MKKKKSLAQQWLEYAGVSLLLFVPRLIPPRFVRGLSNVLGKVFFRLVEKRRVIALGNLRAAFGPEKTEGELLSIALRSFCSFILTYLEIARFRPFLRRGGSIEGIQRLSEELRELFRKAKGIHDESKGCIFVTPHIGNWEMLPHVAAAVGIPLVVVARPLDNPLLERLIFSGRAESGQVFIPKRNALFKLQKMLRDGLSIGLLPDQSTMQGVAAEFFGRKAFTTPVPAILSITYQRPIVVVACCRSERDGGFEGFVSDPILPGPYRSEKDEILRLTTAMNRTMESVIRRHPEQYLWMHNRWKTYKKKGFGT
jgi:KDO2-lipid IV(A) lauroyltransferase